MEDEEKSFLLVRNTKLVFCYTVGESQLRLRPHAASRKQVRLFKVNGGLPGDRIICVPEFARIWRSF